MKWLAGIGREVVALFVDDWSFTVLLLVWIGVATLLLPHLVPAADWDALLLFAGCVLILLDNVHRSARRGRASRKRTWMDH